MDFTQATNCPTWKGSKKKERDKEGGTHRPGHRKAGGKEKGVHSKRVHIRIRGLEHVTPLSDLAGGRDSSERLELTRSSSMAFWSYL